MNDNNNDIMLVNCLEHRAFIVDFIILHDGNLVKTEKQKLSIFGLSTPNFDVDPAMNKSIVVFVDRPTSK